MGIQQYIVIKELIGGGFWDERNQAFRGFLFATKYSSAEVARQEMTKNIPLEKACEFVIVLEKY